jgi:hypothetical protein
VNIIRAIPTVIVINMIATVYAMSLVVVNVGLDTLWIQRLNYVKSHAIRSMIAVLINSVLKIYANVNRTISSMIHLYVNSNLAVLTVIAINLIVRGFVVQTDGVTPVKLTTK